ncbi:MAG: permease-like cell division protein FtsX [Bacteroidaceae bacterium]|nr:permease-like cell division protein FtsX [Bacteroidaceae bacterium]MBO4593146.1 permease-like cell division protein FtsX [Bacteroidaceae bacterium]MBR4783207.1 permease-like cell division protein FtsX [Bacteroidaceae bacterium]
MVSKKSEGTSMNVITACISTTLMLILLGTVIFFVCFAHNFSNSLKENFTVTLMLDENVTQKQAYNIQTQLRKLNCTRSLNYVSKEKAQKEMAQELGTEQAEFLGDNPMPASFELRLKSEYANSDSLEKILPPLKADSLIVDVTAPQNLMDSLNRNIRHISTVLLIVALLLTLVSFVLINNTIRLSIYARRMMIRTMRLVGASYSFIRRPFLRKAVTIGIVSALIACSLLALGVYYLVKYDPEMQALITWQIAALTAGTVIFCGILITWLSAYVSVSRYLKMSREKIYKR